MVPSNALHKLLSSPYQMTDPGDAGTITVDRQFAVVPIVSSGIETRTLAQPTKAGLQITLSMKTYVGAVTVTVTGGYNQAADTTFVLGTAADWVTLKSHQISTSYYWTIVAQEGTNIVETQQEMVISKLRLAVTAVTAVGSVQSLATNTLSYGLNVVKGGGTDLGLTLPAPLAGGVVVVKNNTASAAIVYPGGVASTSKINALATTTGISMGTVTSHTFLCENATQWWTLPLAIA